MYRVESIGHVTEENDLLSGQSTEITDDGL